MKLGEGVEWGIHCCALLAALPPGVSIAANRLAEFHGVPPAYLAKQLQGLVTAGILTASRGRNGGYQLARRPAEVSVLDVVLAIEGDERAFRCTEIRKRGPSKVAPALYTPRCGIASVMDTAEAAWRSELARHTIADLAAGATRDSPPTAQAKATEWLISNISLQS